MGDFLLGLAGHYEWQRKAMGCSHVMPFSEDVENEGFPRGHASARGGAQLRNRKLKTCGIATVRHLIGGGIDISGLTGLRCSGQAAVRLNQDAIGFGILAQRRIKAPPPLGGYPASVGGRRPRRTRYLIFHEARRRPVRNSSAWDSFTKQRHACQQFLTHLVI